MIYTPLMEGQKRIVSFAADKNYAGIFADYGSGKTLAALSIMQKNRWFKSLVVSTKLSLESTWVDEISNHTNFKYVLLLGSKRQKISALDYGLRISVTGKGMYHARKYNPTVFLLNYDGVDNIFRELCQAGFESVFLDESTKIKSVKTDRTKVIWALAHEIPRRYIMTGFPVTEQLPDLYAQIKFLDNGKSVCGSYNAFLYKYFSKAGVKLVSKKNSEKKILECIKGFCVRVTNKSLKLPPKVYKRVRLEPSKRQAQLLKDLYETFTIEFGKVNYDTQFIFSLVTKALTIADGYVTDADGNMATFETPKDKALLEKLEEINVKKNKVLIWCNYIFSIKKLERILRRLKYPVLTLMGETESVNAVVNKFQTSSNYNILIASQKKASESITLTSCKYAIYYSRSWSGDLRSNSEARIRRKGSEIHSSIIYTDLIIKNTPDEQVYNCLRRKKKLISLLKKSFSAMEGGYEVIT